LNSEKYNFLKKHPNIRSYGESTLRKLEEEYHQPKVLPTYVVEKVKRKYFMTGHYIDILFITNDIEELKKFLN
jgi:hypothetical protein